LETGAGLDAAWRDLSWTIGSQVAYGTLFVALAGWQVRPAYRRQEGRAGRLSRPDRAVRRWFPVRPCGDRPVYWKEAFFAPAASGLGGRLVRQAVFLTLAIGVGAAAYAAKGAFGE